MKSRFFESKQKNRSLSRAELLSHAIDTSDSTLVDQLLQEKSQGAYLNLNDPICYRRQWIRPVELMLNKQQFKSAGKLIAAGAETAYIVGRQQFDSDGYPETVNDYLNVFDKAVFTRTDFIDLVSGFLGVEELNVDKSTKGDYTLQKELYTAIESRDYITAGKLIALGASTDVHSRVWVSDQNDCYPYGSYETVSTNVFRDKNLYPSDLKALAQGLTGIDLSAEKSHVTVKSFN